MPEFKETAIGIAKLAVVLGVAYLGINWLFAHGHLPAITTA